MPEQLLDILRACHSFGGQINHDKKYPSFVLETRQKAKAKALRGLFGIFAHDVVKRAREGEWRGQQRSWESGIFETIPHFDISESALHPDSVRDPQLFVKAALLLFGYVHDRGRDGSIRYISVDVPKTMFSAFNQHVAADHYTFQEGNRVRCHFKVSDVFYLHEVDFPAGKWSREHLEGDPNSLGGIKTLNKVLQGERVALEGHFRPLA